MTSNFSYDVIIIGGSYAGLSAAMTLGRAMRKVLILDTGKPCNRFTPHAHNLLAHDGDFPASIAAKAREQVLAYPTVKMIDAAAVDAKTTGGGFEIETNGGYVFNCRKLLFASGVVDEMPAIDGFEECWGKSALHCPYCHGYEVRHQKIALLGNSDLGFEFVRFLHNWSKQLTLFTNGPASFTPEQKAGLDAHQVLIVEAPIAALEHNNGKLKEVRLSDGRSIAADAIYLRPTFHHACDIPLQMGCETNEQGYLKVDEGQRTTIPGVFAAGDNTNMFRALSIVMGAGTNAGAFICKELILEDFVLMNN